MRIKWTGIVLLRGSKRWKRWWLFEERRILRLETEPIVLSHKVRFLDHLSRLLLTAYLLHTLHRLQVLNDWSHMRDRKLDSAVFGRTWNCCWIKVGMLFLALDPDCLNMINEAWSAKWMRRRRISALDLILSRWIEAHRTQLLWLLHLLFNCLLI
jgi:hypothetical protein